MVAGHLDDLIMVEGQGWQIIQVEPPGMAGIGAGMGVLYRAFCKAIIYNGYGTSSRVTARLAKCVELFQSDTAHFCFFFQLPFSCFLQRLISIDESSGQSPGSFKRRLVSLYEQQLPGFIGLLKYQTVYSDRRTGIGIGITHLFLFFSSDFRVITK